MRSEGRLPWPKINDYLRDVGSSRGRTEFCRRAFNGIQRIIPYDVSAGFFDPKTTRIVVGNGLPPSTQLAYNEYFFNRQPWMTIENEMAKFQASWRLCWSDYADSEYATDFTRPNGLMYAMAPFQAAYPLVLSLHRSRWAPEFSDQERAILAVLNPHLNNFLTLFDRLEAASWLCPSHEEIADRVPGLSRREIEVLSMLMLGCTAPEIATRLFISERTVECHVQSIYAKLNVRSRREAIEKVRGQTSGSPEVASGRFQRQGGRLMDWWSLDD